MDHTENLPVFSTVKYLFRNLYEDIKESCQLSFTPIFLVLLTYIPEIALKVLRVIYPQDVLIEITEAFSGLVSSIAIMFAWFILSKRYMLHLLSVYCSEKNLELKINKYNRIKYFFGFSLFSIMSMILFIIPGLFWIALWHKSIAPIAEIRGNIEKPHYSWRFKYIWRICAISWLITMTVFAISLLTLTIIAAGLSAIYFTLESGHILLVCISIFALCMTAALLLGLTCSSIMTAKLAHFVYINFPRKHSGVEVRTDELTWQNSNL